MKKDMKTGINKLNWKVWTLIFAVAVLVGILITSFFIVSFQTWLVSVLFPVILSGVASIGVSLWFTVRTEKDNVYRDLLNEVDELLKYCYMLYKDIDLTFFGLPIPVISKKRLALNNVRCNPRLFCISRYYSPHHEFFENKINELLELFRFIHPTSDQMEFEKSDPFLINYYVIVSEIRNETLKLQERILQDYKIIPKEPIPDLLVFTEKATQDKKTT